MSNRIPRDFINDLIARTDIVDLISARLTLKKSGSNYLGLCPFHDEKTPSFNVSQSKQFYHCFGCGASGNVIGFLMDYDHLSFVESIEDLAALASVTIPRESTPFASKTSDDSGAIYELQEEVASFYVEQLRQNPDAKHAKNYLAQREVSGDIAKRFQIGFAPSEWEALKSKFNQNLLLKAGLIIKNEKGRVYDRFRNRVIFPIRNRRGRVIGFGGRVLDDSKPKYLNSAESSVFQKNKEVYGLYELLKSTRNIEKIIVVEGYMDVIALAQHGIVNAVATLGTSTSKDHIELLFRSVHELVFCFDGDSAGEKAAWRALENSLSSLRGDRKIRFLRIPPGDDPDTLVRREGASAFVERVNTAAFFSEYFFGTLTADLDLAKIENRNTLVNRARPLINKVSDEILRGMLEKHLSELARIEPARLEILRLPGKKVDQRHSNERSKPSLMRKAITLLLQYPKLATTIEFPREEVPTSSKGTALLSKILSIIDETPDITTGGLFETFRDQPEERTVRRLIQLDSEISEAGVEKEFKGAICRLVQQQQKKRLSALLKKAELDPLSDQELADMTQLLLDISTR